MESIPQALAHVNIHLADFLAPAHVNARATACGHVWRERLFTPCRTLHACLTQTLSQNTSLTHMRWLCPTPVVRPFDPSSLCLARQRFPTRLCEELLADIAGLARKESDGRWCGRRTCLLDSTSCSMPDTKELRDFFRYPGCQKKWLGFPSGHLLHLFDHHTGVIERTIIRPRATADLEGFPVLASQLEKGSVMVGDRAFGFYVTAALCRKHGLDCVFRLSKGILVSFKPGRRHDGSRDKKIKGLPKSKWIKSLGSKDQIVAYRKSHGASRIVSDEEWRAMPDEIEIREIRFKINRPGWRTEEVTLLTTLLDAVNFPKHAICDLYLARWQVETNIRHLKQTLKCDVLKGKSVEVVKKEILLHSLAYNLVRLVMLDASRGRGDDPNRISFVDALRWLNDCRNTVWLNHVAKNPPRGGRFEPRRVKRRPKQYTLLTRPRWEIKRDILARIEQSAKRAAKCLTASSRPSS